MNTDRRKFIKNSSLATSGFLFMDPLKKISTLTEKTPGLSKVIHTISVFHTNDLHNQLHPFMQGKLQGYGGLNQVNNVLQKTSEPSILVDAGDFLDGRSSVASHRQLIHSMNQMKYAAATIGNRELEQGQAYLSELAALMKFRLVNCNYTFTHDVLKQQVVPWHIVKWGQYKIGITGVGPELSRSARSEGMVFHDPYRKANEVAKMLKQNTDLVICLSHLGMEKNNRFNNLSLANLSSDIDVIISGHEEKLHRAPIVFKNSEKREVIVSHGGWGGLIARKLSITLNQNGEKCAFASKNFVAAES